MSERAAERRPSEGRRGPPVPDGGYGWAVCLASMWTNGTIFGLLNTSGVLFVSLLESFPGSDAFQTETGRTFGKRLEEHRKEADNSETVRYTRSQKQQAQKEEKKSAVTDHVARNNCVIDWEGARVIDREDNRRIRWIKEAVWIRKSTPVMNRDEGGYKLSHVWDCILAAKAPPTWR
ncbi:hypothetical protein Bbelb_001010 [Branchiostoma belcheri]|nr:hypothetical protein Bbelb_001010 [Branchiostoma belcheri]